MLTILSQITQFLLLAVTVFAFPYSIPKTRWGYIRYCLYCAIIWSSYTIIAMLVDVALDADVPGIMYLVFGVACFSFGSFVFFKRTIES